jgi:hypothetical protein
MPRFTKTRSAPVSTLLGRGWVLPYWLEQQIDPSAKGFVTGDSRARNLSGRNWTLVGSIGSACRGVVDPRGLVVSAPGRAAVDWWVRAGDRWYFPSREVSVRQRLVDHAPVVETIMGVGSGEVIHRVFVSGGAAEHIVVEIENKTDDAIAVALGPRPYDHDSQVRCDGVTFENGSIFVDGQGVVSVEREPGQVLLSSQLDGDVAMRLDEFGESVSSVICEGGLAHGMMVFPLVKSATLRAAVPFEKLTTVSTADHGAIARGWAKHVDAGLRVELPGGHLKDLVESSRRSLHLFNADAVVCSDPMSGLGSARVEMFIVSALQRYGFTDAAGEALLVRCDEQGRDGSFAGAVGELAATGAVLGAIGDQYRLTRDAAFVRATSSSVSSALSWIQLQRRKGRKSATPRTVGLMPPGPSPHEAGVRARYLDNFWSLRGLRDAAMLLDAAGEAEAATSARAAAADLRVDLLDSLEQSVTAGSTEAIPSGPDRLVDETAIDSLSAAWPCEVLRFDHPMIEATVASLQAGSLHSDAHLNTIGPRGLGTYRTMRLAMAELGLGDQRALQRVDWLAKASSATGTWPDLIHPVSGGGSGGPGHSGSANAAFLLFMRELLISESTQDKGVELRLLRLLPTHWIGQNIEVSDAPTYAGRLSYALRWHGRRPLLLWELQPFDGIGPVTITVPGIDIAFSTAANSGEVLLNAPGP